MYCYHCGYKMTEKTKFCPNCGAKNETGDEVKVIQLKCKSCQGIMEVNADKKEVYCPYCGTKELILDSDIVAVEKIKSDAYKTVELARLEYEQRQHEQEEQEHKRVAYKKGKLSKFTLFLTVICLGFSASAFASRNLIGGLISLIQVIVLALSWLTGMDIIKEKRKSIHTALFLLGILLIIPRNYFKTQTPILMQELSWPESGMATYLPEPEVTYGKIETDNDDKFRVTCYKVSDQEFAKYVKECKKTGYTVDVQSGNITYDAFNEEGYKVSVTHWSNNEMEVTIEKPMELYEFRWPQSDIAKKVPKPESNIGTIDWEADYGFCIYVGNTTKQDFRAYMNQCQDQGFTQKLSRGDDYFSAEDSDGYNVNLSYEGFNIMRIRLYEPSK